MGVNRQQITTQSMRPSSGAAYWLVLLGLAGWFLLGGVWTMINFDWFGAGRYQTHPIPLGTAMPAMADAPPLDRPPTPPTQVGQAALEHWRAVEFRNWRTHGKVTAPRVLLAKLAARQDVEEVNAYLLAARPWSNSGSTWLFHQGDYDFSLVTLTTLLYLFGEQPDLLYPETRRHLLDVLLIEEGGKPLVTVPHTAGLILDTENHHLMTEGSRYLKNQWIRNHGVEAQRNDPRYDNRANGLDAWIDTYLDEMISEGVYEFNSRPYIGFTLQALLNLEAFPEAPSIRAKAQYLLDIINLQYALGSLGFRRYPPFRRQYTQAANTKLDHDSHTVFMHGWTSPAYSPETNTVYEGRYSNFTMLTELLPYRLPPTVRHWASNKPQPYFVRFGRGASACPEIYSGGPGYLLSAGGANRGFRSHVVARPVTLMLDDGETNVQRCIHIPGQGPWRSWNTTGVYRHFACANGPVLVPEQFEVHAETSDWRVFRAAAPASLLIAVHSAETLGIVALFPDAKVDAAELAATLAAQNPDAAILKTAFTWPDGRRLEYDVNAPKGLWVMKTDHGEALDRHYDQWPQFGGDALPLSFAGDR